MKNKLTLIIFVLLLLSSCGTTVLSVSKESDTKSIETPPEVEETVETKSTEVPPTLEEEIINITEVENEDSIQDTVNADSDSSSPFLDIDNLELQEGIYSSTVETNIGEGEDGDREGGGSGNGSEEWSEAINTAETPEEIITSISPSESEEVSTIEDEKEDEEIIPISTENATEEKESKKDGSSVFLWIILGVFLFFFTLLVIILVKVNSVYSSLLISNSRLNEILDKKGE